MDRVYQSNAIETPPSSVASSGSYPTAGNKASGQLATVPGPYWFYSITEEIRNAIANAGITPDPAKVNQLAEVFGKYLPLSGGAVTGTIVLMKGNNSLAAPTDDGFIEIEGGTAYGKGSKLTLYGKDHASGAQFRLSSHDGANYKHFVGYANGDLTWDGKNVARTVNGKEANANGDVPLTIGRAEYKTVDDLNTLTEEGVYGVSSSNRSNYPENGGSNGIVVVYKDDGGHGRQVYYRIGTVNSTDKNIFSRSFNTNSGTFGNWMCDIYVVESYKNGASWYRKYSDGWIEQGGNVEAPKSGWTAIPLHIPFSNKNYNLMTCNSGSTTDAFATKVDTSGKNTTTTAYACVDHNSGTGIRWEAKGY